MSDWQTESESGSQSSPLSLSARSTSRSPTPELPRLGAPSPNDSESPYSRLPRSVKHRIVRFAAEQDEIHRARRSAPAAVLLASRAHDLHGPDRYDEDAEGSEGKKSWAGRSLNALALVNHEQNGLSASYLFKELSARNSTSSTFKYSILFRHRAHFKKVIFGPRSEEFGLDVDSESPVPRDALEQALGTLPFLPNLEELVLSLLATETLLGNLNSDLAFRDWDLDLATASSFRDGNEEYALVHTAFKMVAPRILTLRLTEFTIEATANVLGCFTNLRALVLHGNASFRVPAAGEGNTEAQTALEDILASLEHLVSLAILARSDEAGPLRFGSTWSTREWKSTKTLRELRFVTREVSLNQLVLIEGRSTTLETLELNFDWIDADARNRLTKLPPFPQLKSLTIDCCILDAYTLLSTFSTSPLQHLSAAVSLTTNAPDPSPPPSSLFQLSLAHLLPSGGLYSLLQTLKPTLHSLHLGENYVCGDRLSPMLSLALSQMCADLGNIRTSRAADGPGRRDAFFDPVDESWSEEEKKVELAMAMRDVGEVLRFEEVMRKKCERDGDREGLASLIEALSPLKARFELELD